MPEPIDERRLWPHEGTAHRITESFASVQEQIHERLLKGLFEPLGRSGWMADGLVASPGALGASVPAFAIRILAPDRVAHVTQTIQTAQEVVPEAIAVLMIEMRNDKEMIVVHNPHEVLALVGGFLRRYLQRPQLSQPKQALANRVLEVLPA